MCHKVFHVASNFAQIFKACLNLPFENFMQEPRKFHVFQKVCMHSLNFSFSLHLGLEKVKGCYRVQSNLQFCVKLPLFEQNVDEGSDIGTTGYSVSR